MSKSVNIPLETLKCLRGHLDEANKIFESLGLSAKGLELKQQTSSREPKETKAQKVNKYKRLIASGARVTKPEYLKNK